MKGLGSATQRQETPLRNDIFSLKEICPRSLLRYEAIGLGSPLWAGRHVREKLPCVLPL